MPYIHVHISTQEPPPPPFSATENECQGGIKKFVWQKSLEVSGILLFLAAQNFSNPSVIWSDSSPEEIEPFGDRGAP